MKKVCLLMKPSDRLASVTVYLRRQTAERMIPQCLNPHWKMELEDSCLGLFSDSYKEVHPDRGEAPLLLQRHTPPSGLILVEKDLYCSKIISPNTSKLWHNYWRPKKTESWLSSTVTWPQLHSTLMGTCEDWEGPAICDITRSHEYWDIKIKN